MGPISGNTKITVFGKGFHEGTSKYRVLFKVGSRWEESDCTRVEWTNQNEFVA
jgi:hypothetical protein